MSMTGLNNIADGTLLHVELNGEELQMKMDGTPLDLGLFVMFAFAGLLQQSGELAKTIGPALVNDMTNTLENFLRENEHAE